MTLSQRLHISKPKNISISKQILRLTLCIVLRSMTRADRKAMYIREVPSEQLSTLLSIYQSIIDVCVHM